MTAVEKIEAMDAYDLATYAREHAQWLAAVMRSIQLDAKHNDGSNAAALANLGQYLADDLNNFMDSEAGRIKLAGGFQ